MYFLNNNNQNSFLNKCFSKNTVKSTIIFVKPLNPLAWIRAFEHEFFVLKKK